MASRSTLKPFFIVFSGLIVAAGIYLGEMLLSSSERSSNLKQLYSMRVPAGSPDNYFPAQNKDKRINELNEALINGRAGFEEIEELAEAYVVSKRIQGGIERLTELSEKVESDKTRLQAYYGLALLKYRAGRYGETLEDACSLIEEHPDSEYLMKLKSNCLAKEGQASKALDTAQKALDVARQNKNEALIGDLLSNIGTFHLMLNDTEKALNYQKKAIELHEMQNSISALALDHHNLAQIYLKTGEFEKAVKALETAVEYGEKAEDFRLLFTDYAHLVSLAQKMGDQRLFKRCYEKGQELSRHLGIESSKFGR